MSSIKCPKCGMVNFATENECKKCQSSLSGAHPIAVPSTRPGVRGLRFIGLSVLCFAVIILCLWGLGKAVNKRSPLLATPEASTAPTQRPQISSGNLEVAKQIMGPLYKLRSNVEAGLTIMQYGDRILDSKADMDSAMRAFAVKSEGDRMFLNEANAAMDQFIKAREIWSESIQSRYSDSGRRDLLDSFWVGAQGHIRQAEDLMGS